MGIDDLVNQGKKLLDENKDKLGEVLKGDQAEDVSDKILDAGVEAAKKAAPEGQAGLIDTVRDKIDDAIGN